HFFYDVFVTKLNRTGTALLYSTYLGGRSNDGSGGIAVDGAGIAYVTGSTRSSDFPTTAGAFDTSFNSDPDALINDDAFVTKLNRTATPLLCSTYLSAGSRAVGTAVDGAANAYVTSSTPSPNFPTLPPSSTLSLSPFFYDAFVTKLNRTGTALLYST